MFKTVRWKLTLWYAGLLAIILVILGVALYQALEHSLMNQAVESVISRAHQVVNYVEEPVSVDGDGDASAWVDLGNPSLVEKFSSGGIYIEIRDASGAIINRSFLLRGEHLTGGTLLAKLKNSGEGDLELHRFPSPLGRMVVFTLPLVRGGKALGSVQIGRSLQFMDEALHRLQILLLLISGGGMLLAVGVGAALAGAALAPIKHITQAARRIGAADLHERLRLRGPNDEVRRLAGAFDEMLDRLERAFQREKRFTADVSHELRTPLTIVKGTAEVALRTGGEGSPEHQEALETIGAEADRMTRTVESLLTLARADAGQQSLHWRPVDLPRLADEVAAALRPLARAKQVRLEVEHPAVLEITGDEGRLKELLENLVDNAVKYTSAGGWVRVTVDLKGDDVRVTVADSGIGIPGEAVRHVFERFYRVDAARSREEGGTGLGLAIVEWIVQAHGGRVVVDSRPGEGTLVTVRLPRTHGAEA